MPLDLKPRLNLADLLLVLLVCLTAAGVYAHFRRPGGLGAHVRQVPEPRVFRIELALAPDRAFLLDHVKAGDAQHGLEGQRLIEVVDRRLEEGTPVVVLDVRGGMDARGVMTFLGHERIRVGEPFAFETMEYILKGTIRRVEVRP